MKIAQNTVVSLEYSLHLGDGKIIDSSDGEALVYLHGSGQLIPGLERQLTGLEAGKEGAFTVAPADAYGEHEPEGVQEVPRSSFGGKDPQVGDEFTATDDQQHEMQVRVIKVEGDKVTVDFNHPLAGKTLHFQIKVKDIRAATEEELSHGHAHGAGGHHHH